MGSKSRKFLKQITIISAFCMLPGMLLANTPEDTAAPPTGTTTQEPASSDLASPDSEKPLDRWLTLDQFSFSSRYRNSVSTTGLHPFESGQERNLVAGKFKLDRAGKYQIGFRASSGKYFNWAYSTFAGNNFSPQTAIKFTRPAGIPLIFYFIRHGSIGAIPQSRGWIVYMRELYLSASPFQHLTLEFGGLGFDRGVASEITTFDEDGYLTGERIRLKDKQHLYFDQISATFGYIGNASVSVPNFFARGTELGQNNYRQISVEKKFGKRVAVSAEYDWLGGLNTMREAGRVNIKESKVLDTARLELYHRLNSPFIDGGTVPSANGWSAVFGKDLFQKKWQLEAGYADIDRNYGIYSLNQVRTLAGFSLNGDSYQTGARVFTRASYTPHPFVTLFGFYTHEFHPERDPTYTGLNRQTVQGGVTVNFKSMLEKSGLL